jgi:hypothetical protein
MDAELPKRNIQKVLLQFDYPSMKRYEAESNGSNESADICYFKG